MSTGNRSTQTADFPPAVIERAKAWREVHAAHVTRICNSETSNYPPSGWDVSRPELWKAAHWKWLESNYGW